MNAIVICSDNGNLSLLENYKLIPYNQDDTDYIHFYSSAYYSKWEAEENQTVDTLVGVKHDGGGAAWYNDTLCWSSGNLNEHTELMYGPHYHQERKYKRFTTGEEYVKYIVRYNMALKNNNQAPPNTDVCTITARVTQNLFINGVYQDQTPVDTLIGPDTLRVSDFDPNGHFKEFYFSDDPSTQFYSYEEYPPAFDGSRMTSIPDDDSTYNDYSPHNGIEFCVEWLGSNLLTLYIDNVEVYDNFGWNDYVFTPNTVIDRVQSYAANYSQWTNIAYWYGHDEPSSLDSYIPMHIVDEILNEAHTAPLITHFVSLNPVNVMSLLDKFVEIAQPHKLLIDDYPFHPDWDVIRWQDIQELESHFQHASSLDPKFYYTPQAFGEWLNGDWLTWRRPDTSEFKIPVMLALAYGAKGLIFSDYDTYTSSTIDSAIVGGPPDFEPQDLYYVIRDNLVPRLHGKLGKRLLRLNYTGNYISKRHFPGDPTLNDTTVGYLTLPYGQTLGNLNWHAGFFDRNGYSDDKYFFLVNLLPQTDKTVGVKIKAPVSEFKNIRFRNYEGYFDTTFYVESEESFLTYTLSHTAGEGCLYEVAPVIRYGGKLYHDETVSTAQTLRDDMTIENGITLTVDATYDCYANIYTKGSGKIQTVNGGTIIFHNGKGIITQGNPYIVGTSSHKLTIDFETSTTGTGIQLLQGANAHIDYCVLKNSINLISADNSQFSTLISYCDFQNTSSYAISLAGTSTRTPSVTHCTFTNTNDGIFAAGQNTFTLSYNIFTNNAFAVNFSQISSVQIIGNNISSNLQSYPGIFLSSCGGNIRGNIITGHSIGVSLANSSPLIGDNHIYGNKINGIYVGAGSVPDLRATLVGVAPKQYPIAGYNEIRDNGGYDATTEDNDDGSEIYLDTSNIQMDYGCNLIADNRSVTPNLYTTLYLMNGVSTSEVITARYNAWGDTVYSARFGNLSVTFSPYNQAICDIPVSGDMLIMQDNDGNILDTVYSTGTPNYTPGSTDLQYASAAEDMINLAYAPADETYNSIISSYPAFRVSEEAYLGLYKSARLQNADSSAMENIRELYTANLDNITDPMMKKVVSQLALLTLIDQKQYNSALDGFVNIILQNPESEEALFAEIDAMTTSLLAGNGNDTTLNKGLSKDLLVKGSRDYQDKINKLIQKRFGAEAQTKDQDIIPTAYSLDNNYPNPFNPTTTNQV